MNKILLLLLIIILLCNIINSYNIINKIKTITKTKKSIILKSSITSSDNIISNDVLSSFDYKKETKLPWISNGYKSYKFNNYKINYVELGDKNKPSILLIHGFGASAYHWRYNIPILARDYHVYAIDLLGFGLSEKPIIEYNAEIWRDQTLSFIENVIYKETGKSTVVAGNSLGGFTALYAASNSDQYNKKLINGCILLNAAGIIYYHIIKYISSSSSSSLSSFSYNIILLLILSSIIGRFKQFSEDPSKLVPKPEWQEKITAFIQRLIISISFIYTKQPARIEQVLKQVYPVNPNMVDNELVESIQFPAQDPNAAEVFYRVIKRNGNGPMTFIDDLLDQLKMPLLLLWGVEDPWIRMTSCNMIKELYPKASISNVNAGHCPHDEAPDVVNVEIDKFIKSL